jgi:hypothetical protein
VFKATRSPMRLRSITAPIPARWPIVFRIRLCLFSARACVPVQITCEGVRNHSLLRFPTVLLSGLSVFDR